MSVAAKKKKIFDGRYEILAIVGRGACSVVYHARHAMTQSSEVALKVLLNQRGGGSNTERLRKEALAMVSSRHKYVVRLDDFHSVKDLCYLAMEYAREGDMRKFVTKRGGKLAMQFAEPFFLQTAEALNFVHRVGITHRDIKPDNVLVMSEREVRLADFGVAVLPGELASLEDLRAGVGTMSYMAPEVLEGKACDKLSDIYSLGVTFYEMLSGVHPFENLPLIKQLEAREDQNVKHIGKLVPDISPGFAELIMRCMRYQPNSRFPSMAELLAAFEKRGEPVSAAAAAPAPETPEAKRAPEKPGKDKRPEQPRPQQKQERKPEETKSQQQQPKHSPPGREAKPSIMPDRSRMPGMRPPVRPPPVQAKPPPAKEEAPQMKEPEPIEPAKPPQRHPDRPPAAYAPPKDAQRLAAASVDLEPDEDELAPFDLEDDLAPFDEPLETKPKPAPDETVADEEQLYENDEPPHVAEEPEEAPVKMQQHSKLRIPPSRSTYVTPRKLPGERPTSKMQRLLYGAILLVVGYILLQRLFPMNSGVFSSGPDESADAGLIPAVVEPAAAFPDLPDGMFVGTITNLVPGQTVPLTIVSMTMDHSLTFLVGMNGWTPISSSYQDGAARQKRGLADDEIQIVSNGFVLNFKGAVQEETLQGTFRNVVTGEEGTWTAAPVKKAE